MKEYVGLFTVSFDTEAHDRDDLRRRLKKMLHKDLTLEDIEIDSVYSDGEDVWDEADRFNDDRKLGI